MPDLQRGVVAAGSWFAITYGAAVVLGLPISASAAAASAAYLGASAVASDYAHNWLNVYPSMWTSALGTGLLHNKDNSVFAPEKIETPQPPPDPPTDPKTG